MKIALKHISLILIFAGNLLYGQVDKHPNLVLTQESVKEIRLELGNLPVLDRSVKKLRKKVDPEIEKGIVVPVPKDPAGGYTHNKHKQNYIAMQGAGVLWQITQDKKYLKFVKEMLLEYSDLYPTLELHPVKKSYAPGKLFWQSLNEAVWLVYTSQAYDCVYNDLSKKERKKIEKDLLIPYANFLSVETPKVFNRVHNHAVWANAAVGMTGLVINNRDITERVFKGVEGVKDRSGLKPGFYSQLDNLFSPDGYYTEGPYYQRYALLPYMLLAQAINNHYPEKEIFKHRNGILPKALYSVLQLSDAGGKFFPINDAVKGMSVKAPELVISLGVIYNLAESDKSLLSIAKEQNEIFISPGGLKIAKDISLGLDKPFNRKSIEFSDGKDGNKGAVGILRSKKGTKEQSVLMKYASHGMGHGHFDRLSILYFENENEILQDYGAARFVNIIFKDGGRYLSENKTWAKQSIAHNTVVVDSISHFLANTKNADKYNGERWIFNTEDLKCQIMSAKEKNAYKGIILHRTVAFIDDPEIFENSIIIDIFRIESDSNHTYDLPYYYKGQLMFSNCLTETYTGNKGTLGSSNGYQHLWLNAKGKSEDENLQFIWLNEGKFYSIVSEKDPSTEILYSEIGANDPNFNLRHEPCFIIRQQDIKDHVFLSTIESHGWRNPNTELTQNIEGSIKKVRTVFNDNKYTIVEVSSVNGNNIHIAVANDTNDSKKEHIVTFKGKVYKWEGVYKLFKNK